MKKNYIFGILVMSLFMNCNSHKTTHTHDDDFHSTNSFVNASDTYLGSYDLKDEIFGTKTKVTLTANTRIMVTNSLPNHKTGAFPNEGNPNSISAQEKTYVFPLKPKYTGNARWIRQPGVAINGVKFEPGTAEIVVCETGENYRVEAFQDLIDLGLDFNHAHVQPTGAYHYHGIPTSVIENSEKGTDLVHIGFAQDGFPMYYSKSGVYAPSYKLLGSAREGEDCTYDNPHKSMDISVGGHHDGTYTSDYEYVKGSGDLDECNGITVNGKYMYLVTNQFPYISRCLMGAFSEEKRPDGPPPGRRPRRAQ